MILIYQKHIFVVGNDRDNNSEEKKHNPSQMRTLLQTQKVTRWTEQGRKNDLKIPSAWRA